MSIFLMHLSTAVF